MGELGSRIKILADRYNPNETNRRYGEEVELTFTYRYPNR